MRIVADTNTIVSGLLWHGPPRQVLDHARIGEIELFTTMVLLAELEEVLQREKFVQRLMLVGVKSRDLVVGYAALAKIVESTQISPITKLFFPPYQRASPFSKGGRGIWGLLERKV